MSAPPRQLTDDERAAREARIEAAHKDFLRAVTTSHSLPSQQSSTAGAGGTTNQKLRMAEDHEAERLLKMKLAADAELKEKRAQTLLDAKAKVLADRQQKKKAKRAKKESAKKQPTRAGASSSSSENSCSDADAD